MAWHSGTMASNTGGELIAELDNYLVLNSHWTEYDGSAGANAKTYRCLDADENVDFYLWVQDNQANFTEIKLWGAWDAVGHAGVGIATSSVYWRREAVAWYMSVKDHRLIYVINDTGTASTDYRHAYYAGEVKRFDARVSTPLAIGMSANNANNGYSPIGWGHADSCAWRFLRLPRQAWNITGQIYGGPNTETRRARTVDDEFYFWESLVMYQSGTNDMQLMGSLDGAAGFKDASTPLLPDNGDTITDQNGAVWLVVKTAPAGAKATAFIRED